VTGHAQPVRREIPVSLIDDPELPSRSDIPDDGIDDLVESILHSGFFGAIVVVPNRDRYRVVAGHRRTIAARRAGLVTLPCSVYPADSDVLEAVQDEENARQEEWNVVDQAIWYAQLLEKRPAEGTDGVARRARKSRDFVEGRLALLEGDADVLAALRAGEIKIGIAHVLNQIGHEQYRRMYLGMAIENGVSIGTARDWLREYKKSHEPALNGETAAPPPAPSSPLAPNSFFACVVCQKTEDSGHMQQFFVHDYCAKSRLNDAVVAARAGTDYLKFPRTREEALALVERVTDRFPELFDGVPAQP